MFRRAALVGFAILVAGLVVFSSLGAYLYTEWLWFRSLGQAAVFGTVLGSRVAVGVAAGALFALALYLLLWLARRSLPGTQAQPLGPPLDRLFQPRSLNRVLLGLSLAVGLLVGLGSSGQWLTFQAFLHRVPFGVAEPVFGRDAGFYVFTLPVYAFFYRLGGLLFWIALPVSVLLMLFSGGLEFSRRQVRLSRGARIYYSGLLAAFFLYKALGYRLAMFRLLYSPRGVVLGASYADVHAGLPALWALLGLAAVGAVLAVVNVFRRDHRLLLAGVGLLVAASLLLGTGYPLLVQEFVVSPNEMAKERPYILNNIKLTRYAYDLERISERPFAADETLTRADLDRNRDTVDNIRLWDWRPLQQTYAQLQEMRLYYNFGDVDVDRYTVDGRPRQVLLSAREISQDQLPEQAHTWINLHLKYTHGYGAVVSPATEFTTEGLPLLWVRDIPPQTEKAPALSITRPEIYYGEQTTGYAIVRTREPEFDYPLGDQNTYTTYEGTSGVPVGSFGNRLAFALRLSSYRILFTGAITPESRVLFRRDIGSRVRALAPFLLYDTDPYLVMDQGRLLWIQDAYTRSGGFPYSQPYNGQFNYLRNSVKVVIDAYEGDVTFYVVDESDPLTRAYRSVFPSLFTPASQMPESLLSHLRYPEGLFQVQAEMYASYHMQDPVVFYNREDYWEIPSELLEGEEKKVRPYYVIMRLPEDPSPEFMFIMPFTPSGKQNMIAWMAARCDPAQYGQLLVYKFPKQRLIYGPMQIEARINQDPEISQRLTLWGQKGSEVLRGNLLVVPIENSLLYVEPLYLVATENRLPELKRVIASFGGKVVMGTDLPSALELLFGEAPPLAPPSAAPPAAPAPGAPAPGATGTSAELASRASELLAQAQAKAREGDWAGYGRALQELQDTLRALEEGLRR